MERKQIILAIAIIILSLGGIMAIVGCDNKATAPSDSTVTMSNDLTVGKGFSGNILATVEDSNGNRIQGITVDFITSHPGIAGFNSTKRVLNSTNSKTGETGIASVAFYTYSTGAATIIGTTNGISDSTTVTVE